MNILFEDQYIIVLKKEAGIPVQTSKIGTKDMVSILKNYLFEQAPDKGMPYVGLVHRLDQPVEGVMVFAKTTFAAKELSKQIQNGNMGYHMDKYYLAVVCGQNLEKEGTLSHYLQKDGKTNLSRVVSKEAANAKLAQLNYNIIKWEDGLGLVDIELLTGRHHQIRVQMANAGMPLWGDTKYNKEYNIPEGYTQIALCAYKLCFYHPKTKKALAFQVEPSGKIFEKFA